jgi:hypothetical protein
VIIVYSCTHQGTSDAPSAPPIHDYTEDTDSDIRHETDKISRPANPKNVGLGPRETPVCVSSGPDLPSHNDARSVFFLTFKSLNCIGAQLGFLRIDYYFSSHIGCQMELGLANSLVLSRLELPPTMQGTVIWNL